MFFCKKFLYLFFCTLNTTYTRHKAYLLFNIYEDNINAVFSGCIISKRTDEAFQIGAFIKLNYKMNKNVSVAGGFYNYNFNNIFGYVGLIYYFRYFLFQASFSLGLDGSSKFSLGIGYYIGEIGDDELFYEYDFNLANKKLEKKDPLGLLKNPNIGIQKGVLFEGENCRFCNSVRNEKKHNESGVEDERCPDNDIDYCNIATQTYKPIDITFQKDVDDDQKEEQKGFDALISAPLEFENAYSRGESSIGGAIYQAQKNNVSQGIKCNVIDRGFCGNNANTSEGTRLLEHCRYEGEGDNKTQQQRPFPENFRLNKEKHVAFAEDTREINEKNITRGVFINSDTRKTNIGTKCQELDRVPNAFSSAGYDTTGQSMGFSSLYRRPMPIEVINYNNDEKSSQRPLQQELNDFEKKKPNMLIGNTYGAYTKPANQENIRKATFIKDNTKKSNAGMKCEELYRAPNVFSSAGYGSTGQSIGRPNISTRIPIDGLYHNNITTRPLNVETIPDRRDIHFYNNQMPPLKSQQNRTDNRVVEEKKPYVCKGYLEELEKLKNEEAYFTANQPLRRPSNINEGISAGAVDHNNKKRSDKEEDLERSLNDFEIKRPSMPIGDARQRVNLGEVVVPHNDSNTKQYNPQGNTKKNNGGIKCVELDKTPNVFSATGQPIRGPSVNRQIPIKVVNCNDDKKEPYKSVCLQSVLEKLPTRGAHRFICNQPSIGLLDRDRDREERETGLVDNNHNNKKKGPRKAEHLEKELKKLEEEWRFGGDLSGILNMEGKRPAVVDHNNTIKPLNMQRMKEPRDIRFYNNQVLPLKSQQNRTDNRVVEQKKPYVCKGYLEELEKLKKAKDYFIANQPLRRPSNINEGISAGVVDHNNKKGSCKEEYLEQPFKELVEEGVFSGEDEQLSGEIDNISQLSGEVDNVRGEERLIAEDIGSNNSQCKPLKTEHNANKPLRAVQDVDRIEESGGYLDNNDIKKIVDNNIEQQRVKNGKNQNVTGNRAEESSPLNRSEEKGEIVGQKKNLDQVSTQEKPEIIIPYRSAVFFRQTPIANVRENKNMKEDNSLDKRIRAKDSPIKLNINHNYSPEHLQKDSQMKKESPIYLNVDHNYFPQDLKKNSEIKRGSLIVSSIEEDCEIPLDEESSSTDSFNVINNAMEVNGLISGGNKNCEKISKDTLDPVKEVISNKKESYTRSPLSVACEYLIKKDIEKMPDVSSAGVCEVITFENYLKVSIKNKMKPFLEEVKDQIIFNEKQVKDSIKELVEILRLLGCEINTEDINKIKNELIKDYKGEDLNKFEKDLELYFNKESNDQFYLLYLLLYDFDPLLLKKDHFYFYYNSIRKEAKEEIYNKLKQAFEDLVKYVFDDVKKKNNLNESVLSLPVQDMKKDLQKRPYKEIKYMEDEKKNKVAVNKRSIDVYINKCYVLPPEIRKAYKYWQSTFINESSYRFNQQDGKLFNEEAMSLFIKWEKYMSNTRQFFKTKINEIANSSRLRTYHTKLKTLNKLNNHLTVFINILNLRVSKSNIMEIQIGSDKKYEFIINKDESNDKKKTTKRKKSYH